MRKHKDTNRLKFQFLLAEWWSKLTQSWTFLGVTRLKIKLLQIWHKHGPSLVPKIDTSSTCSLQEVYSALKISELLLEVEVGGTGGQNVDPLQISQAKHIWYIHNQITQKHKKKCQQTQKVYYPYLKLFLAHIRQFYGCYLFQLIFIAKVCFHSKVIITIFI